MACALSPFVGRCDALDVSQHSAVTVGALGAAFLAALLEHRDRSGEEGRGQLDYIPRADRVGPHCCQDERQ